MNYTEQLRIQKLEEVDRLITEHNFHLELLLAQKAQLTPIVTQIKEKHEKEKELKVEPEGDTTVVGDNLDVADDNNRDNGTDDQVS